jgi:hypothetical protein
MVTACLFTIFLFGSQDAIRQIRTQSELKPIKSVTDSTNSIPISPENHSDLYRLLSQRHAELIFYDYGELPTYSNEKRFIFKQRIRFENIILGILAQHPDLLPVGFLDHYTSGSTLDVRSLRIMERLKQYIDIVLEAASVYSLDPCLLFAVITQESAGKADVVSSVGAKGLMQLMDATASILGVTDSFDPYQNVMGGAKYIREQYDRFGAWELALAAYNAGPGAVKKYNGIPPYQETQNYVNRIMKFWTNYRSNQPIN